MSRRTHVQLILLIRRLPTLEHVGGHGVLAPRLWLSGTLRGKDHRGVAGGRQQQALVSEAAFVLVGEASKRRPHRLVSPPKQFILVLLAQARALEHATWHVVEHPPAAALPGVARVHVAIGDRYHVLWRLGHLLRTWQVWFLLV